MTNSDDVRKGIVNAAINEEAFGKLAIQIFIVAVGLGFYTGSWLVFLFVLVGLVLVCGMFRRLALIIVVVFSLGWGYIGYLIGSFFGGEASIVLGILGLMIRGGVNWQGVQYMEDIG